MAVGFRSSSLVAVNDAQRTTIDIAVPAGATTGDIVICYVGQWEPGGTTTITPPSGFTQVTPVVTVGSNRFHAYWKRVSNVDEVGTVGSYTFSWSGIQWSNGFAVCITGALASGDPIGANVHSGTATGTSYPTLTISDLAFEPFLAWGAYNESAATSVSPTDFTEVQDANYGTLAYRIPGTTGSFSASGASIGSSMDLLAVLAAVEPDAGGEITGSGTATAPAVTIDGTGSVAVSGSGQLTSPAVTLGGTGAVLVAGSGGLDALAAVVDGVGTVAVSGSGDLVAPAAFIDGVSTLLVDGSGGLTAPAATLAGTGNVGQLPITGSGALVAGAATLGGSGTVTVDGTGTILTPGALIDGTGAVIITGAGVLLAPAAVLSTTAATTPWPPSAGSVTLTEVATADAVALTGIATADTVTLTSVATAGTVALTGVAPAGSVTLTSIATAGSVTLT